jgi:Rieske Fe-S protein
VIKIMGFELFNNTKEGDIKPGEGGVVKKDGKKIAMFRDKDGKVSMLSAKCTHMGCTVQWNKKEGTWDCPCHGSRFDVTGKVIHGPAGKDLQVES